MCVGNRWVIVVGLIVSCMLSSMEKTDDSPPPPPPPTPLPVQSLSSYSPPPHHHSSSSTFAHSPQSLSNKLVEKKEHEEKKTNTKKSTLITKRMQVIGSPKDVLSMPEFDFNGESQRSRIAPPAQAMRDASPVFDYDQAVTAIAAGGQPRVTQKQSADDLRRLALVTAGVGNMRAMKALLVRFECQQPPVHDTYLIRYRERALEYGNWCMCCWLQGFIWRRDNNWRGYCCCCCNG